MAQAKDKNLKVTGLLFQKMTGWIPGVIGLTSKKEIGQLYQAGTLLGGVFEKSVSISPGVFGRINSVGWSRGTVMWEPVMLNASPTKKLTVSD